MNVRVIVKNLIISKRQLLLKAVWLHFLNKIIRQLLQLWVKNLYKVDKKFCHFWAQNCCIWLADYLNEVTPLIQPIELITQQKVDETYL